MNDTTTTTTPTVDALFGRTLEADKPAPMIEREQLRAGAVVRHKSARTVKTSSGNSVVHSFELLAAPEGTPWFSLWGSANLNSQLRKAKPGAVLLLRYLGQDTNADNTPGAHQWEVKPSTAPAASVQLYLSSGDRPRAVRDFATIIDQAQAAERERRASRRSDAPAAPEHTDDDFIPF